jgi:hypothetical protein
MNYAKLKEFQVPAEYILRNQVTLFASLKNSHYVC